MQYVTHRLMTLKGKAHFIDFSPDLGSIKGCLYCKIKGSSCTVSCMILSLTLERLSSVQPTTADPR